MSDKHWSEVAAGAAHREVTGTVGCDCEECVSRKAIIADAIRTALAGFVVVRRDVFDLAVNDLWHKQVQYAVSAAIPSQIPCADDCVKCKLQAAARAPQTRT